MHKGDPDDALHLDLDPPHVEHEAHRYGPAPWVLPALIASSVALIVCLVTVLALQHSNNETVKDAARVAAVSSSKASSSAIKTTQVTACNRSQVVRGLDRYRTDQAAKIAPNGSLDRVKELTDAYQPILDCRKTYLAAGGGKAVMLPTRVQTCFIALVAKGYWIGRDPITDPALLSPICKAAGI